MEKIISNGVTTTQPEIDTRLADRNTVTDGVLGLAFLAHPETR